MNRSRDVFLPPVVLDRALPTPLHDQVRRQIARAIRACPPGVRLPSTRALARLLGVSRNTVLTAYDDLAADGMIEGRRGAGMRVAGRLPAAATFDPRRIMRAAQFPARTIALLDPDGTSFYLLY